MDIPIEGELSIFVEQLKNKGFKLVNQEKTLATLERNVLDQSFEVQVSKTPKTFIVYKVELHVFPYDNWKSLKKEYKDIKDYFTEKYGKPISIEMFSAPYKEGDGNEIKAVKEKKIPICLFGELKVEL